MRIYFVRHGESRHNAAGKHQPGTIPLSDKGMGQAQFVAQRFQSIPIEVILASDYERAHQTAKVIAETTGKELILTDLARERKTPSEIHGKSFTDPEAQRIKDLIDKGFNDPDYHYSDEENFHDLKNRALELIDLISSRPEENLLVVLHGTILRCVVGIMMFGEMLTPEEFSRFRFFVLENTGITVCERENNNWKLITWNDKAHLG